MKFNQLSQPKAKQLNICTKQITNHELGSKIKAVYIQWLSDIQPLIVEGSCWSIRRKVNIYLGDVKNLTKGKRP